MLIGKIDSYIETKIYFSAILISIVAIAFILGASN